MRSDTQLDGLLRQKLGLMDRTSGLGDGAADQVVDEVAAVTAAGDWSAVRRLYVGDERLRVPEPLGD